MSAPLPEWARTKAARELIDVIVADPPESRVVEAMGFKIEQFSASTPSGKLFCRLRQIYRLWFERQLAAMDAQYAVTGKWSDEDARALHAVEDAQALVTRLIAERGEEREAA